MQADLIIYNENGQIAVIIEVKNKLKTSREWAAKTRRNLLAHGLLPKTLFFLLALPDRFYLWKNAETVPEVIEPDYTIDSIPLLKSYYEKAGLIPEKMSSSSFELIVATWLSEIMQTSKSLNIAKNNQQWLLESGFLPAITGGNLVSEVSL